MARRTKASDLFYHTAAWQRARAAYLRAHPCCETPGCREPATLVHHRVAIGAGGARLDPANFEALCAGCHGRQEGHAWGGRRRSDRET